MEITSKISAKMVHGRWPGKSGIQYKEGGVPGFLLNSFVGRNEFIFGN
jgi:hypothetical protein